MKLWPPAESVFRWGILILLGIPLLLSGALPEPTGDITVYEEVGEAILAGQVPYRDFLIEYPPGALPVFVLPALLSSGLGGGYQYFFAAEMVMLLVATLFLTAATSRCLNRPWLPPALVVTAGFLVLLWHRIPNSRYDAVVAFALAGAAWATAARRIVLAWAFLGFGTLAKLIPVIATAALYPFRQGRLRGTLVFVGILLAGFVPAFLASPAGFLHIFSYHANRGLHIESFAASILFELGWVEGIAARYGAVEVVGGLSEVVAAATLPVTLALLLITGAGIWREAHRGCLGPAQFPRYAAALLLAFIVGSKVLSPQYLIWLIPLVPLAFRGVWGVGVSALLLLACWFTNPVLEAFYYGGLPSAFPTPSQGNPSFMEMRDELDAGSVVDSQRFLSLVDEYSLFGVHPVSILLGRNILLLVLWLAMLLVPYRGETESPRITVWRRSRKDS